MVLIKSLSDLVLSRFPKITKEVFLDQTMPEILRKKAAVLFIENFLIKNALNKVSRIKENEPYGHGLHHVSGKREKCVLFCWFGRLHGVKIFEPETMNPSYVPSVTWYKLGLRHGPSTHHVGYWDSGRTQPKLKCFRYENGVKTSETLVSSPVYNASTSYLTKEASKRVFRYARDVAEIKVKV